MHAGFELRMVMATPEPSFGEVVVPMRAASHARPRASDLPPGEHHTDHHIPPQPLAVVGREAAPLGGRVEVGEMWVGRAEGLRN